MIVDQGTLLIIMSLLLLAALGASCFVYVWATPRPGPDRRILSELEAIKAEQRAVAEWLKELKAGMRRAGTWQEQWGSPPGTHLRVTRDGSA